MASVRRRVGSRSRSALPSTPDERIKLSQGPIDPSVNVRSELAQLVAGAIDSVEKSERLSLGAIVVVAQTVDAVTTTAFVGVWHLGCLARQRGQLMTPGPLDCDGNRRRWRIIVEGRRIDPVLSGLFRLLFVRGSVGE